MSASHRHIARATKDATNPSTVPGMNVIKPSTVGLQNRGKHEPSTQRPAKSGTIAGMKFSGKTLKAVRDWVKDSANAAQAFAVASKAKEAADALQDTEYEDPEVTEIVANFYAAALAMLQKCLARGQGVVDMVQGEQSTDATAGQPDEEGVVETNSGQVPHKEAMAGGSGAVDSAAMDAGGLAVRAYAQDVSVTHVATVDAATLLAAERAEWKKVALLAAITDGDDIAAHRIRFGLAYPTSVDPVGDFMKRHQSSPTSDGPVADYLKNQSK